MMYMLRGFVGLRERGGSLFTCVAFTAACTCEVYVNLCTVNEMEHRHNHICLVGFFFPSSLVQKLCDVLAPGVTAVVRWCETRFYIPQTNQCFSAPRAAVSVIVFFNCVSEMTCQGGSRDFSLYLVPPSVFILHIYFILPAYHLSV